MRKDRESTYDAAQDKVLAEYKQSDKETGQAVKIQLLSYRDAPPKVKITLWWFDKESKEWVEDRKAKFPRFRPYLLSWIFQAEPAIQKALDEWNAKHPDGGAKGGKRESF